MMGRNDPCWCGSGKKWKKCHFPKTGFPKTSSDNVTAEYFRKYKIRLKTPEEIEKIRKACHCSSRILEQLCNAAKEGVTTAELDALSRALHTEWGAIPAALHYGDPPYPFSICTSLNEMICHGFANNTPLKKGDILNIDVASILNGYYGDCSKMVVIGKTTPEKQRVVDTAYTCLMESIAILEPGIPLSEVGKTIERIAHQNHCSVVHQFVGHGVGNDFHEPPQVHHNYVPHPLRLAPGMTFTIEPMINTGVPEAVIDPSNQWEARTADGKPSAQWEHTILITDQGYEILTDWIR